MQKLKSFRLQPSGTRLLLPLAVIMALAACGGGGGGSSPTAWTTGSTGGSTGTPGCLPFTTNSTCVGQGVTVVKTLSLTADVPTIQTDGTSVVSLVASLKDAGNGVVKGQEVSFSADSGELSASKVTTDATTGLAQVVFNSNADKTNRTVNITARYGSLSQVISVAIQGTRLGFGGDASGVVGSPVSMTISLLDAAGKAIANQDVSLRSSLGNGLPATVRTNTAGQASFSYTPTVGGADTITASALGASAARTLELTTTAFAFSSPASGTVIPINTCQQVSVSLLSSNPATGVNFVSSRGSIYASQASCQAGAPSSTVSVPFFAGIAAAWVRSPSAGAATVSAILASSVADGTTAKRDVSFVSTTPTQIVVQSDPSTLTPNGTAKVYAIVRDNSGNPVAGSTVVFTAPNGGGQASPTTAQTDASGQASTTFIADPNLTGKDSVTVVASVLNSTVTRSTTLTVAGQGVNMVISTNNLIQVLSDPPRYRSVWGVSVTDTAGNPVRNQQVTVGLKGTEYQKGSYAAVSGGTIKWAKVAPITTCAAEDANNDGFFQTGEVGDIDGDGILEPNGAAFVMPPSDSATQASSVTVTTNQEGVAAFWVQYLPQYATWASVELAVTAAVNGLNSRASRSFYLAGPADELTTETVAPSFAISPFGRAPTCYLHD